MNRREIQRRLLAMLRPHRGLVVGSVLCRIINQTLGVLIPVIAVASVAKMAMGSGPRPVLLVALLVTLALVKGLFRYLEQFTGHAVAFHLLAQLRTDAYRNLVPLAAGGLDEDRSGDLVNRVIGDVDRVEPFFAHTIAPISGAVVVPALAVGIVGLMADWMAAAALVPFLVLFVVVPWLRGRQVADLAPELRTATGTAAATLTDASQGIREIVAFDAADRVTDALDKSETLITNLRGRLARIAATRTGLVDLVAVAAVVAMALVVAAQLRSGQISLDGVAVAITAAWVVALPARAIEEVVPDLEQSMAAAGRLFELADRTAPVSESAQGPGRPKGAGAVLRDVTVRHPSTRARVLDGVSLELPGRGFTAVVGPSGSGKSTLVDVLLRFRSPDEGDVFIGGADLSTIPAAALRSHIAVVPQRPDLFHGTIADNLRLADPDATERRLWAVLERVGLADWVRSLDRNLETQIGELGDRLSGGQRQRLALARALLRPGALLVLDEATSELDPVSEAHVMATLRVVASRYGVLFVAHRLSTVVDADRIVVLDEGRIVEVGTHQELLDADGLYAGLWKRHSDTLDR